MLIAIKRANNQKLLPAARPMVARDYIIFTGCLPYETVRECLERQFPDKSFDDLPDGFDKAVKAYTDFFVKTLNPKQ